ncbi:MAG: hypothetical protein JXM79_09785 [Sedimentisphaerales bacterium]|nr:hypothetical protein [Sedimentisphaerales bacterium]
MRAKDLFIILVMLGVSSSAISANEEYRVVRIWPEAPRGWHFYHPWAVAVDESGNVYVGDLGNYLVKKFDSEGRFITQWGNPGKGDGQFQSIVSIKTDSSGIVYVVDWDRDKWEYSRIQKFTPYGEFIGMFERQGPDVDTFELLVDVAFSPTEDVYVLAADYMPGSKQKGSVRIERYSSDGNFLTQWGDFGVADGQFQIAETIAIDKQGDIYVADSGNHRVQKFDPNGKFLHKWGDLGSKDGQFRMPQSIAFDAAGNVYVLDLQSVQKFTSGGQFLEKWKPDASTNRRIAVDNHGFVYVTQQWQHRVLRFDSLGKSLEQWGIFDARHGHVNSPQGVAIDSEGNLLAADNGIQRFNSEGQFLDQWDTNYWMTISGIATDKSANLYITLMAIDQVYKINRKGEFVKKWGWMGEKDGEFRHPSDIAVDPLGNVYVADKDNHRIQKFDPNGTFLTKWGMRGVGKGEFTYPGSIALDGSGNIYVLDQPGGPEAEKCRIQKFDPTGAFTTTWSVSVVDRITCDTSGDIYAIDHDGSRIAKFDSKGDQVATIRAEDGGVFSDICTDKTGHLFATDLGNARINEFDSEGKVLSAWPTERSDLLSDLRRTPGRITVDGDGNLYVHNGPEIWKLSSTWKVIGKFQIAKWGPKQFFCGPRDVAIDTSGSVYVCSLVNTSRYRAKPFIQKFRSDGQFAMQWQWRDYDEESKARDYPISITVDSKDNVYVADTIEHIVTKFDRNGHLIKNWGGKGFGNGELNEPEGIAVDEVGNVYVCDRQNCRIQKFDSNGRFLVKWGRVGSGDGEFHFPAAVAVDKERNVFVADSDNHRIQKFTTDGKFLIQWGEFGEAPGQFNVPLGIAVDAEGNVFVSDSHNHRIQKFAPVHSP